MKTTLKEKIILLTAVAGFTSNYAENFLYALEQAENPTDGILYQIYDNSVIKEPSKLNSLTWSLEYLIGELVLNLGVERYSMLFSLLYSWKQETLRNEAEQASMETNENLEQ